MPRIQILYIYNNIEESNDLKYENVMALKNKSFLCFICMYINIQK